MRSPSVSPKSTKSDLLTDAQSKLFCVKIKEKEEFHERKQRRKTTGGLNVKGTDTD